MNIFEFIAKKTNFCVGIGFVSLISVIIVATMGLGMDYYMMQEDHIELFWSCVFLAVTYAPFVLFIQFALLGLIKPLTLKSFRPLNMFISGLELEPEITFVQLNETIEALKNFTIKFTLLSFFMATIAMAAFILNPIIKGYELMYIMSQVIIGSLVILVYSVSSFFCAEGRTEIVRRRAYRILAEYKKIQASKDRFKKAW